MSAARGSTAPRASSALYCAFCAAHDHRKCIAVLGKRGPCACGASGHEPDDLTAAAMRLFFRSDLLGDTAESLAAEYRAGVR